MTSVYPNVFSNNELEYLNNHHNILYAKTLIDSKPSGSVNVSIPITESIRTTLESQFGLHFSSNSQIPMRWIKGDTARHLDVGPSSFKNTYLLYLTNSPGELIVDSQSYPIEPNTGYVFNEGISHETRFTENIPRLLLGPMNEFAEPVGASANLYTIRLILPSLNNLVIFTGFFYSYIETNIVYAFYDSTNPNLNIISSGSNGGPTYLYQPGWLCFDGGGCNITKFPYLYGETQGDYNLYGNTGSSTGNNVDGLNNVTYEIRRPITYYPTEADALANTNSLGFTPYYIVGNEGPFGYTSWRIASNSYGTSSKSTVYVNGNELNSDGAYFLYPSAPCFLEGTTVLCKMDDVEKYVPVEELKTGTLVKTSLHHYKKLVLLGKGIIQNPGDNERTQNRLYKCSTLNYPNLKTDLYITGCHSILEFPITAKQKEDIVKHLGELFITDKKYRLLACVDERAEPWNSKGTYTIWHFALENSNESMNYGVYVNGGLLVESCSIRFLKTKSNMILN
jgi:hypothetical protein